MAIKVKHEGNVTSRLVGAAQGGRGRRRAEDAKWLAQLAAQENMAAMRDTRGISAAPLTHAGANAQLGHAPTMGAPSGTHAPVGRTTPIAGIGARAGASAALPSRVQQSVVSSGRGAANPPRVVSRSASVGPTTQSDYKITGTDPLTRPDDTSEWVWEGTSSKGRWIRPWQPGEKEAETLRRTGEVQNDLAAERELTTQGRREREALVNDVIAGVKAGRFSPEELPKLMEQFDIAEDTIRMADALREQQPTPEQDFRRNTYTDQNGIVFDRAGKVLYNPQDIQMRQAEAEAKRLDALKARADKFEAELRKPYRTSQVVKGIDGSEDIKDSYGMRTEEEIETIMRQRFPELYPSAADAPQTQGAPTPAAPADTAPTTQTPPTEDPDDPLAAFKKFRN